MGKNPIRKMKPGTPLVSLCMIVRDEERFLSECLESAREAADEIVVVDTGSRDRTVEIAREFQAKVVQFPWNDDFAAARNRSLEASSGRWVLTLDADERVAPGTAAKIREAAREGGWDVGLLPFINMRDGQPCGRQWLSCRVFRRTPGMRYVGRIHEQLIQNLPQPRTRVIESTVYHYGYEASLFAERQKKDRNAKLIELALAESESQGPLMHANYLFHYANLASNQELLRRYENFAAYVRQQWPERLPDAPWIVAGLAEQARLLSDTARHEPAAALARELLARYGESPLMHYIVARARAAAADCDAAERELETILRPDPPVSYDHQQYTQDVPLVQGRARFLRGLLRESQGCFEESLAHYQAAVAEEPDQEILRARLACALARLERYPEALQALEGFPALLLRCDPGVACLGFVLALLAQSVARLAMWGERVREAADSYRPAAVILERVAQLGPGWPYRLEDFPEVARFVAAAEPAEFEMPQTERREVYH